MSAEHNLYIQGESVRGEGRWYFAECSRHHFCDAIRRYDRESAFTGSRARQRAERALEEILMMLEEEE